MGEKTIEKPLIEYDESEIPEQVAKGILESPEDTEEYFPCPYKYFFKGDEVDREMFYDLKEELKDPTLLSKKLKTQEELEEEIQQDSQTYESEWDMFLETLSSYMDERNEKGYWETPCTDARDDCHITNKKQGTGSRMLACEKGKDLIHNVIDFDRFQYGTGPIRIFDYKKTGFKITAQSHDEIYLLPACRTGFIRDWDKDGVCVEELEED